MKPVYQNCGSEVIISGLGRKAINLPVIKVCDALRLCHTVSATAGKLGCSRAYIYKVLKANCITSKEIIQGNATKDTRLLHKGIESD